MRKILIGGVALVLVGAGAFLAYARTLPCPSVDALLRYRPPEATRVFALDGSRLADLSSERRVVVAFDDMPRYVRDGFVAVEDRRFYQHGGIDVRGIGRAIVNNVRAMSAAEGFSTITMQIPRNVFPTELPRSSRYGRKICEVRMAGEIERRMTKQQILELYVNQVYMGEGLYGVEEATRGYFGKPASQATLAESALLVGMVKNPGGYNPRKQPLRAIQRRNTVLEVFAREGLVTTAEAEAAKATPLTLAPPIEAAGPAPYFVAAVRQELRERFGDDAHNLGLRVYTGLDPALQQATQRALVAQIEKIESGAYGRYTHDTPDAGELAPATGNGSPYLQGMAIVLDSRTGEVRALVGGRDFTHSSYDRALDARRQPGSAFKPILFAAAVNAGLTAGDPIDATPVSIESRTGVWAPDDLAPDSLTTLSLRDALALSSNNAAVRVGEYVGVDRVIEMARSLGISTEIPPYPSITLGAAEVIPAEFVSAIAALGNGGYRVPPTLIKRVEDAHGNVLWQAKPATERALDENVAFITTSMMEDVIERGTARTVRESGFWLPAAGKTGTTNDAKDVWFVGMKPDLAAGVWLGFDQPKEIAPYAYGGRLAAPVWIEAMNAAYAERPAPEPWTAPPGVVQAPVDVHTGQHATGNCPSEDVRIEYFLDGSQPMEYCPLHPESSADRAVDRLLRGLRRVF